MSSVSEKPAAHRVLVVEDDADTLEAMVILLQRAGHEATGAATAMAGIGQAIRERPDVVLIDLHLPDLDGCEVARSIRAKVGQAIRLVAVTGSSQPSERDRVRQAGFDAYIVKPIDPDTLGRIVAG